MGALATIEDVLTLTTLTSEQMDKAEKLLEVVSDRLRFEAEKVGKNLDDMISDSEVYAKVVASVIAGIVERTVKLAGNANMIASQYSESALGYSYSATVPNAGESLYIKNSELKALGLKRQKYGVLEFYGN